MALLGFLFALLIANQASAQILIEAPEGGMPYQEWIDAAQLPTPDRTIRLIEGSSADPDWPCQPVYEPEPAKACVDEATIYWDPAVPEPRWTLYHELGHVVDPAILTAADREWFMDFLRLEGPWLSPLTHDTPGENFADVFAYCMRFGLRVRYTQMELEDGRYIYPRKHYRLCKWVREATRS